MPDAETARWNGYMAEMDRYWANEASRAYAERKAHVWEVYACEGIKPWMQWQVSPSDLPFKIAQH